MKLGKTSEQSRAQCMQCYLSGHSDGSLDSVDPSTECSGSSINDTSTVSATDTNQQQSDTTMMTQRRVSLRDTREVSLRDTRERSRDRDSGILEDSNQHQTQNHPNTNNNNDPPC